MQLALKDVRIITHAVQHASRKDRDVAFVAAGLPIGIEDLLNDDVLTFLRRAERFALAGMPRADMERALRTPITTGRLSRVRRRTDRLDRES